LVVPEVIEVHVVPLSDEVRIVPDSPTTIKELFPKPTPFRRFDVPEVLEVHEVPLSEEVMMVPEEPTPTKVLFPYVISLI